MNMKRYDTYKPSGIDWIGEVPEHWDRITLQNSANTFIDGDWIESPDIASEGIRYITTGNIGVLNYKEQGNGYITEDTFKRLDCTEVFPGDILISRLNEPIGRSCIIPDLNNRIVTSVDNVIYRPKADVFDKRFVVYQMNCYPYTINANLLARGTTMHRISRSTLGKIKLILPPIAEQEAIAAYLDARCADIDKVVATQQKRIALLQELKQSEITQAVTRGLNPDARMKDSGVEWIGMVPEHWERCRFKDFITLVTKPSVSETKIGLENIESGTGRFIETDSEFEGNGVEFYENDVVYGKLRPYLQKVWLATFKGNAVGDFFVFREKKNSCSHFLKYLLLSDGFTKEADGATVGAKMPRVSSDFILTMRYYLPERDEQVDIAEYLDRRCGEIDRQIGAVTRQIELLREYKQALITEVVTGKRKV